MIFWYPKLPGINVGFARLGGPGLGNLLFPWARAIVKCYKPRAETNTASQQPKSAFVDPMWRQLKIGPILRRESDARTYWSTFEPTKPYANRAADFLKLLALPRVNEQEAEKLILNSSARSYLAVVEGMGNQFADIAGHNELVSAAIRRAATSAVKAEALKYAPTCAVDVAVHVRLGDFTRASSEVSVNTTSNTTTPISWFQAAVNAIDTTLGRSTRAEYSIFSDGEAEELAPILKMPRTKLIRTKSALASILAIADRDYLIASGSTFSMWSAYLGNIPTIYFPGQMRSGTHFGSTYEAELSESQLCDSRFIEFIDSRSRPRRLAHDAQQQCVSDHS